jgi:hypothetical protein
MTKVRHIQGGLLPDRGIRAVVAKLQARRLGCVETIVVTFQSASRADGYLIDLVRTMVMAFTSLQQTCIGDARSQPEQPRQQHHECGST